MNWPPGYGFHTLVNASLLPNLLVCSSRDFWIPLEAGKLPHQRRVRNPASVLLLISHITLQNGFGLNSNLGGVELSTSEFPGGAPVPVMLWYELAVLIPSCLTVVWRAGVGACCPARGYGHCTAVNVCGVQRSTLKIAAGRVKLL